MGDIAGKDRDEEGGCGGTDPGADATRACYEGRTEGAFSGLSMALTAVATSATVPWLVTLLVR